MSNTQANPINKLMTCSNTQMSSKYFNAMTIAKFHTIRLCIFYGTISSRIKKFATSSFFIRLYY